MKCDRSQGKVYLIKTARIMASNSSQCMESHIVQLNDQVQEKRFKLKDLESKWEAKKDAVARKAHTLLTSIHETFEQITEKILATDRSRRNIADYEAKFATYDSRSLNMDRLRVDLDAIGKENDLLVQHLHNT